nr:unnamed protein product [Digitaria exilis]
METDASTHRRQPGDRQAPILQGRPEAFKAVGDVEAMGAGGWKTAMGLFLLRPVVVAASCVLRPATAVSANYADNVLEGGGPPGLFSPSGLYTHKPPSTPATAGGCSALPSCLLKPHHQAT